MSIEILLHLSLIKDVGPVTINRIIETGLNQDFYQWTVSDFIQQSSLSPLLANRIVAGLADKKSLERELFLLEKHAITLLSIFDDQYPVLLKNIYAPPPILYIKGSLSQTKAIALVGSRKATDYARHAITSLIIPLVTNGWTLVSGGALGADTFAHKAVLEAQGITYAVLGSGLLRPYPSENNNLFRDIVESGGALISPFNLEQGPLPGNFPARNRIIAGLSQGCIVAQAAQKSGALTTARFALEQGRELFVIPGPIDDPLSHGSNNLIQQGAKLIMNCQDILCEFNETTLEQLPPQEFKKIQRTQISFADLSPDEQLLYLCKNPIALEKLSLKSGVPLFDLQLKLFDFQLEGKIQQNFAGFWQSSY